MKSASQPRPATDPRWRPDPQVISRAIGEELVLLNRAHGQVHHLNPTASLVWKHLEHGTALPVIAKALTEAYEVDDDIALADVERTVASFVELGLLRDDDARGDAP